MARLGELGAFKYTIILFIAIVIVLAIVMANEYIDQTFFMILVFIILIVMAAAHFMFLHTFKPGTAHKRFQEAGTKERRTFAILVLLAIVIIFIIYMLLPLLFMG